MLENRNSGRWQSGEKGEKEPKTPGPNSAQHRWVDFSWENRSEAFGESFSELLGSLTLPLRSSVVWELSGLGGRLAFVASGFAQSHWKTTRKQQLEGVGGLE